MKSMSDMIMVIIKEQKVQKSYEDVCHDLGFAPEVRFVKITTRGTISFTCGRPSEVRLLLTACREHGYKPSRALIAAAER